MPLFEDDADAGAEAPGVEDEVPCGADGMPPGVPAAEGDPPEEDWLGMEEGLCGEDDPDEDEVLDEEVDGLDDDDEEGLDADGDDGLDVDGELGIDGLEALLELWLWLWLWLCCMVLQAASESSAAITISNADRFSISLMAASVESLRNSLIFSNIS